MSTLKLEFLTEELEYLRPMAREVKTVEERAEAVVPESCPDVTGILYAGGQCFLRGWDLEHGAGVVALGISAVVLARVEGRSDPEPVEVYIPVTLRVDASGIEPGQLCLVRAELRRVDGHMLSSRKVQVRAAASVFLQTFAPCREQYVSGCQMPEIELLKETVSLRLPVCMGDRQYSLEDTVHLSTGEQFSRLLDWQVRLKHTEWRLTGTRAVFRGQAEIHTLCLTDQGALVPGQAQLPFSQYLDLDECGQEDQLQLHTCLTGAEASLAEDGSLDVNLQLRSTALVWGHRERACVTDLYALNGDTTPAWRSGRYESLLDQTTVSVTGQGALPTGGQISILTCMPGALQTEPGADQTGLKIPVTVRCLLGGDPPDSASVQVELNGSVPAAENCRVELVHSDLIAEPAGGDQVRVSGTVTLAVYGLLEQRELSEAELTELPADKNRPALVIRRVAKGESLWDIARQYRTTRAAIERANVLEEAPAAGTLLLIPGR